MSPEARPSKVAACSQESGRGTTFRAERSGLAVPSKSRLTWSALQLVDSLYRRGFAMRISAFAARSGLSVDTLRYYERIGLLPRSGRDSGGRRDYGSDDLVWATFLRKLQAMDMPMRERLEYSRLRAEGDATLEARRSLLEAHRIALIARRSELSDLIAGLDDKITHYRALEATRESKDNDDDPTYRADLGNGPPAGGPTCRGAGGTD
ncbi:MerR family transcriptional regulator [Methylobacterium sp.]|uniref:MerR family transcriptional regulator n=2 Tax=Methylobacterium sp. TaxID=409 RepID=UPI003B023CA5